VRPERVLFNIKHGLTVEDEVCISPRIFNATLNSKAPVKPVAPIRESMVKETRRIIGEMKNTGKPLKSTLREAGLEEYIKDI
jgi:aldehyde:ferredoxin oxidoreductase